MPSPSAAKRSARGSPPKPPGSGKKGPAAAAPPPEEEEDTRSVVPLHSDYDTKQGGARGQDGAAAEAARWGEQKIFEWFFLKKKVSTILHFFFKALRRLCRPRGLRGLGGEGGGEGSRSGRQQKVRKAFQDLHWYTVQLLTTLRMTYVCN